MVKVFRKSIQLYLFINVVQKLSFHPLFVNGIEPPGCVRTPARSGKIRAGVKNPLF